MKRVIKYIPKTTTANTNYREVSIEDMAFIQEQMIRWLAVMGEKGISRDEDDKWVNTQWWLKRTSTLPKSKTGENTPCSFVSGMINNFMFGNQRDLTEKQMDAIMVISHIMGAAFESCTEMMFQIGFDH